MKTTLSLLLFLAPAVSFAGEGAGAVSYLVIEVLPLVVAIIFGLIASVMVLQTARKIQGGVLASVYQNFGLGMLLILLGFSITTATPWFSSFLLDRLHDLFFVIGFALMAYGSNKLLHRVGL